ncbi:MAG: ABC transporter ATP-binding protein [Candidatus Hodarchaeales archaeon]|jgi:ATP-binding cassette subfamily B protein
MSALQIHHELFLPQRWYRRGYKFWLAGHVLQHRVKISIITIATIIGIFLQTIIPFILGYVFAVAIPAGDVGLVLNAGTLVISIGLAKLVTNSVAAALNEVIAQYVEMQIRVEFYQNLETKSMSFHDSSRAGDLIQMATGDTRQINASISPGVRITITTIFTLLFTWIAMFIASPSLSLVFLLTLPLYIYFLSKFGRKLHPLSKKRQAIVARMNAELQENLTGVRVVRTFSVQEQEIRKFHDTLNDLEDILKERGITSAFYIPSLILGISTALIFLVGILLIESTVLGPLNIMFFGIPLAIQSIGIGELITFLGLTSILAMPTLFLRWILDMTLLGFAGAARIFNVVTHDNVLENGTYTPKEVPKGIVKFEKASFSYTPDSPRVLNEINLEILPGETVAIIGPTGCGKTTLGKMIYRLYDVIEGFVHVDNKNVKDWDIQSLRQIVGVIEQDTFLFTTSIRNNIAYGKHNSTNEEIMAAAIAAQAHDFIEELPEGYDTIVGERGVTLSGGQRQRVAMARGFLADPKILIMDDATSAVDAATESRIQVAIQNLLEGRTTIIITHRLSTLKTADKIIFMEKGRILRIGTHTELITSYGPYRSIFKRYMTLPPLVIEGS